MPSVIGAMHWRVRTAIAADAVIVLAGLVFSTVHGVSTVIPAAYVLAGATALLVAGVHARHLLAAVAVSAGGTALTVSVAIALTGDGYTSGDRVASAGGIAETGGLFILTVLTARDVSVGLGGVATVLPGIAMPFWLLRFGWDGATAEAIGGFVAWAVLPLLAVAIGLYLRALDEQRRRSVDEARRRQRDQLARDLHDFVAHDISGMLAQAQAGQILAERDPTAAAEAFQRIEESGMKALASMDRTVHMLYKRDDELVGNERAPRTLIDLPEVVSRFSRTGQTTARLELDPILRAAELPPELTTTAHRVVVEALTNVRRHAPTADQVVVNVHRASSGRGLNVIITDDGPLAQSAPNARRGGGLGLSGLNGRVEALGGTLTAGPADRAGWRVVAYLPLPNHVRTGHG